MGTAITPALVIGILVAAFFVGLGGIIIGYLLGRQKFEGTLAKAEYGRMYKVRTIAYDEAAGKFSDFPVDVSCMQPGEEWVNTFPMRKAISQRDLPG
jgi:hypothetical protein